jgi:hypothetical protein
VTNVYHPHRPVHDYKQNSIGSAIAGADQQLTDWLLEMNAFRRMRTALGKLGERFDTRPRANDPPRGRSGSAISNITIYVPKIGLGLRCDDDAVA